MRKDLLYALGVVFIMAGIGSLAEGFTTSADFADVRGGRIGYGIIFLAVGAAMIWGGSIQRTHK